MKNFANRPDLFEDEFRDLFGREEKDWRIEDRDDDWSSDDDWSIDDDFDDADYDDDDDDDE